MKAVIVGHSSGLGLQLVNAHLHEGWEVVGLARSSISQSLPPGSMIDEMSVDVSRPEDLAAALDWIRLNHPDFARLFYCAGQLVARPIGDIEHADLAYSFAVNALGAIVLESGLMPLVRQNGAAVVNITSSTLIASYPLLAEYGASKAALSKFTRDLRESLRDSTARVMEVCPSGFRSEMYQRMRGSRVERDETLQMPVEDVASLVMAALDYNLPVAVSYLEIDRK